MDRAGLADLLNVAQLQLDRHLAALALAHASAQRIRTDIDRLCADQARLRAALVTLPDVASLAAAHRQHAVLSARLQVLTGAGRAAADQVAAAQQEAARSLSRVEILKTIAARHDRREAPS